MLEDLDFADDIVVIPSAMNLLKVQGNEVEKVDSLTYLGANVTQDGGGTVDIRKRIAMASAQF